MGFKGGRDQQIFAASLKVAAVNAAEAAAEPGVAERGVGINRVLEPIDGLAGFILGGQ